MRNDIQVSKNFNLREFEDHSTGEVMLDSELLAKLQTLREKVGKPIRVTSGYRTREHNKAVGGSPNSQHLYGKAADIVIGGMTSAQIAALAKDVGFRGIGIYPKRGHCHVDVRETPATWTDNS